MAIDHDSLFKALIGEFFLEFLELFLPKTAADIETDSIREKEQELLTDLAGGQTLRVDLIRQVQLKDEPTLMLVLVEPQSYEEKEFAERLFLYFIRLYDKYRLTVLVIGVLSYNSPRKAAPNRFVVGTSNFRTNIFNFTSVQLNRLDWEDYIKQNNPVACAMMAKMRMAKKDRAKVKLTALTKLTELDLNPAQVRLISTFVDTYLRLDQKEENQFRQELAKVEKPKQEVVMELTTSWMEEGIIQGKREGKREGEINLLLKMLAGRFGPLGAEEEGRVRGLEEKQLENLAQAIFDFKSKADLSVWLQTQIQAGAKPSKRRKIKA